MRKIRPPKSLAKMTTAAEAAEGLREIADELEAEAHVRPMVRWFLSLHYWNPVWTTDQAPEAFLRGISYNNTPSSVIPVPE